MCKLKTFGMQFLPVIITPPMVSSKCSMVFLLFVGLFTLANCSAPNDKQYGEEVYKKHCAGCHGHQLQGSTASSLIKEKLNYSNDRNSIIKVIHDGIPMTQMVKWDTILTEKEIGAVADYILAVREDPATVKADVKPLKIETKYYKLNIEKLITEGMNGPWGIEFVDANRALITGKMG
jgi:cytochrome c553